MKEELMRKYARLAVIFGTNVQPGQTLVVSASTEAIEMTRLVVEEAYRAGAGEVIVNWSDDYITRQHYLNQSEAKLCDVKDWQVQQKTLPVLEGACLLSIVSDIPGIMKDVDMKKVAKATSVRGEKFQEMNAMIMASKVRWSVIGVPNKAWAKQVFPDLGEEEALAKLWDAVLKSCHIDEENDPIAEWQKCDEEFHRHMDLLNEYNFKALHFVNDEGTDLTVELIKDHIWKGGSEAAQDGSIFFANIPTEEVFCMPYKYGVNGIVHSSRPLNYAGVVIDRFTITFKDGKAIDYQASNHQEALDALIHYDEGSAYLGEVALVPYHSPLSQMNLLFYETLYDENASCHLAFGDAYPINVKGGEEMSLEALAKVGANHSLTHVDFMFGTASMNVTGITYGDEEIAIFKQGDFVI